MPAQDQLATEVLLIAKARSALERGRAAETMQALAEHRAAFPAGQLVSERYALETRARCLSGDGAGAQQSFRELLQRAPRSRLRVAVESACGPLLTREPDAP
jgi:hypothetical protein